MMRPLIVAWSGASAFRAFRPGAAGGLRSAGPDEGGVIVKLAPVVTILDPGVPVPCPVGRQIDDVMRCIVPRRADTSEAR
ncbi:hypothetical protein GCM10027059_46910 [Myceligenerans halotolerans]